MEQSTSYRCGRFKPSAARYLTSAEETASSKDQVLFAVTKLGTAIRKALGDATSDSAQRFAMETLSAASLEAVHEYSVGLDALSSGKDDEAQRHFSQAVDLDHELRSWPMPAWQSHRATWAGHRTLRSTSKAPLPTSIG